MTERTFTAAEMAARLRLVVVAGAPSASQVDDVKGDKAVIAAAADELLASAEREAALVAENERLKDELGTTQGSYQLAANGRDRAESALAAERQNVQALRDRVEAMLAGVEDLPEPNEDDAIRETLRVVLADMDDLGLTPAPPAVET